MLYKYLPRAKEFITWSLKRGASFHKTEEIDSELADYLEDACYSRHKGFNFGFMTFFGFLAVSPSLRCSYPVLIGLTTHGKQCTLVAKDKAYQKKQCS